MNDATIQAPTTGAAIGTLGISSPAMPRDFIIYRGKPYATVTVTQTAGGEQYGVCDFRPEYEADRFECSIADMVAELDKRGHAPAWGDWRDDLASMGEADLGDGWSAVLARDEAERGEERVL